MYRAADVPRSVLAILAACLVVVGCARPVKDVMLGGRPEAGGAVVVQVASAVGEDPREAGRAAAEALRQQMGATAPAAVLVSENYEGRKRKQGLLDGVTAVFPPERVFGMATYGSFVQGGCLAEESVALVGIGGPGVAVSAALERDFGVATLAPEGEETLIARRLRGAGQSLAAKLPRRPNARLLILLADAHSPKNRYLVEGVQKTLGADFPIVGGCANKNAGQTYVIYAGRMFQDSGVALLLTGDFHVALAGRMAKDNARVIATAREAAAEAKGRLKAQPLAALAFNCAGRKGKLDNIADELAAIQKALGSDLPLFGCYCAGEIGPPDRSETAPGVRCVGTGWHVMFALLGR